MSLFLSLYYTGFYFRSAIYLTFCHGNTSYCSFYSGLLCLYQNQLKHKKKKEGREGKYRPISMVNTESKILNKIFENQTWAYIKMLSTMTKMPFVVFSPANKEFCFLFSYYYLFNFLLFPNCSRSGEHGYSGLIPDFNVMTSSVSPFPIVLAVGLPYIAFIMVRYITSRPTHPRTFIMKVYWILSKRFFFSSIEVIIWSLFLSPFVWFITFIDLSMLNHTCISTIKPM